MTCHRDVAPCGWARIPAGKYVPNKTIHMTTCDVDVSAHWTTISHSDSVSIAPLRIASFDIECVSFDGQFPLAKRDYRKIATNFLDEHDAGAEDIGRRFVTYFRERFRSGKLISKTAIPDLPLLLGKQSDNVAAILHGTAAFDAQYQSVPVERSFATDDCEIVEDFARKLQRMFPALEGDPIIQIGVTQHVYGEKEASERHIFVLGTCDDIPGAKVYSFGTERELLLAWSRFIVRLDPDVLLGYNIHGFDFQVRFFIKARQKQDLHVC